MARILRTETSLKHWHRRLERESRWLAIVARLELVLGCLLLASGAVYVALGGGVGLLVLGVLALFLAVAHNLKIRENAEDRERIARGREGEQSVSGVLERVLPEDYLILNDILLAAGGEQAQIDHLVIGPNGVFTLETKNWRGVIEGDEREEEWLQHKEEPDGRKVRVTLRNPVLQNLRQLGVVRALIRQRGISWDDLVPIVVSASEKTVYRIRAQTIPIRLPAGAAEQIRAHQSSRRYSREEVEKLAREIASAV